MNPETQRVLDDVKAERARQIEKGWTPEHDDRHTTHRMVELAGERLRLPGRGCYDRSRLIEGIAILVAAVEAWDRREGGGDAP